MKKTVLAIALLLLSGCASCETIFKSAGKAIPPRMQPANHP